MARIYTITLPVRGDGKGDNVFAHAAALARRFGAHVQVLHCRPTPEDLMPYGVVVPNFMRRQIEDAAKKASEVEEDKLREEFRELSVKLGLTEQDPDPGTATTGFVEYTGKQVDAVRHYGRLADLVCVPSPDRKRNLGENTLKSALYSTGRPVLICPQRDSIPDDLGSHVAIGWNGSLEATRAVAMAIPLIEAASKVTILTTGKEVHAATAEELVAYLALRGVSATVSRFERRGNIGRSLLELCKSEGADILVMGAYHESYERETIFGGNTQVVVDEATIPVVLVH
ncbi:universal stress protein UspA [Maritimibacter sp. 55A14]|uniref:universal stress protein n=1 Tax=Maritimibacter sp. 55A14 TaxID=2174844 RepID=UPI000D61EF8B|nr:universal stress protein [Maritimibacter sp. 55A14]PWE33040.1 universal stress protein UspA [Maritimibacter sp. 55A14]